MPKKRKQHSRDPYLRKMYAGYDDYMKRTKNNETLSKQERREETRRTHGDERQHEMMMKEVFRQINEFVFNDKILILSQPMGDLHNIIVVGEKYETYFGNLFTQRITEDGSVFNIMAKAIADGDKHFTQVNFNLAERLNNRVYPKYIHNPNYYVPQLDLRAGGYVDHGSFRHHDHINCLLTRDEFVITAQAVRGLGKGSYRLGGEVLYNLQNQWRREAKQYSHVR